MKSARANTVELTQPVQVLARRVIGFATRKEAYNTLRAHGLTDKDIYLTGRGAENLSEAIERFRGQPGELILAEDCRAFGKTKEAVADRIEQLEAARITIRDLTHPEYNTFARHQQFAHQKIAGKRLGDKRQAKRMGKWGGLAKGIAMAALREGEAAAYRLLENIAHHPALTWRIRGELVKGVTSAASLRRHYTEA